GALDVVGEGEECVGTQGNAVEACKESALVLFGQPLGLTGKVVLPDAVGADIFFIAIDVAVNDVIPVGTAQIFPEGQIQCLRMLAQEEGVGLGASQPGAVNPGLLTGAHTHSLTVIGKADGVGLGVFQGNQ